MKNVYAVYGDIMTAKEVLPAMQILENRGFLVSHIVDSGELARAPMVLDKEGIKYSKRDPISEDMPDVIVVGTSVSAIDAQIKWTQFGRENNISVIWVEDFYGTGENEKVLSLSPDVVCTVDEIAKQIIELTRPNANVEVVGKPSFEQFAKYLSIQPKVREDVCDELNIGKDSFIVTLWAGAEYKETTHAHILALRGLDELTNRKVFYLPRLHPKTSEDLKDKFYVLASEGNKNIIHTDGFDNPDDIVVASNINVGGWGTNSMYIGSILGIPSVMCLFPEECHGGIKERIRIGYKDGIPPLVMAKAGWGARNEKHLKAILSSIMNHEDKMKEHVRENSKVFRPLLENTGAAERIADVVENYVNKAVIM
jgi:hypothetical protein